MGDRGKEQVLCCRREGRLSLMRLKDIKNPKETKMAISQLKEQVQPQKFKVKKRLHK